MNSLTTKLTLSFLLVGILGAGLVALISTNRTRAEFRRFLETQTIEQFGERIATSYAETEDWTQLDIAPGGGRAGPIVIVDTAGTIVVGPQDRQADLATFGLQAPIEVNGQTVGTLYMRHSPAEQEPREGFGRSENRFINNVLSSSTTSAAIASAVALGLALVLSRQLTRPIRALTDATQRITIDGLGKQVAIRSNDEIGRLAAAFNKMSEDLADESQKRRQMTADIAHDLRTPLTILSGYMQGLQDGSLQSSPKLIQIMHEEVQHLDRLVTDLRTLSLADAGELSLNQRDVDPKALLERTGLAYVVQAEQQGVRLRVEAETMLPPIEVDTDRMTQVLNNLVSNALRYTEDGEIVLRASAENGHVDLEVSDTGSGILPDALPHIFDRFYRADQSRQRQTDGGVSSGLGLAIAKAIVHAHQGVIKVRSSSAETSPSATGTTFTITLPAAS